MARTTRRPFFTFDPFLCGGEEVIEDDSLSASKDETLVYLDFLSNRNFIVLGEIN